MQTKTSVQTSSMASWASCESMFFYFTDFFFSNTGWLQTSRGKFFFNQRLPYLVEIFLRIQKMIRFFILDLGYAPLLWPLEYNFSTATIIIKSDSQILIWDAHGSITHASQFHRCKIIRSLISTDHTRVTVQSVQVASKTQKKDEKDWKLRSKTPQWVPPIPNHKKKLN